MALEPAAGHPDTGPASGPPAALATILSAIPPPPRDVPVGAAIIRARRASALGEIGLFGSQVYNLEQATAQVDNVEHSCVLSPGGAQLSWAMYAFPNLLPEDAPLAFSLLPLGEVPPSPCFLGFADYRSGSWDWTALSAGQQQYNVGIGAGAEALSPGGSLYVVVASYGSPLGIGGLRLQLDCPNPPPEGLNIEPGDGDMVMARLSWIDPAVSFDPDGGGPEQFAYDGVLLQRATAPDGPWVDAAQLPPGTTGWDDPLSISGNPPPESGYYYHVMTLVTGATLLSGVSRFGGLDLTMASMFEAKFTMSPASGNPGQLVSFDGTGSLTVGGTVTLVKWDFEGDGKYDETTTPTLTTTHTYASAARYYPRLMLVEDVGGDTRTDIVTGYIAIGDKRGDWSQLGRNCQHTRQSPMRGPKSASLRGSYDAGAAVYSPAIGADGKVYVGTALGSLVVLNADCSLDRAIDLLGGTCESTPAIDKAGNIWLMVNNGGVNMLKCVWADGSVHSYPPSRITGKPVVTADGLYALIAADNYVYQATPVPAPGDSGWWHSQYIYDPSLAYTYTPAVSRDGYIYVLGTNASVKLTPTLTKLWKSSGVPLGCGDPMVANTGYVYSGSNLLPRSWITGATADGSWAYLGNLASGSLPTGSIAATPEGNIYTATDAGWVYGFPPKLGPPSASYHALGEQFVSSPILDANGRVYALTASGKVYCLSKGLAYKWYYNLGSTASACELAFGNDGTLYIGGTNKLVALK